VNVALPNSNRDYCIIKEQMYSRVVGFCSEEWGEKEGQKIEGRVVIGKYIRDCLIVLDFLYTFCTNTDNCDALIS